MRSRLAWLVGGLGVAAVVLYRRLRRRPPLEPAPDAHAEELRRKLDEARAIVSEREEFESAETPVDRAATVEGLDERRRQLHERGRAALEEMREPSAE